MLACSVIACLALCSLALPAAADQHATSLLRRRTGRPAIPTRSRQRPLPLLPRPGLRARHPGLPGRHAARLRGDRPAPRRRAAAQRSAAGDRGDAADLPPGRDRRGNRGFRPQRAAPARHRGCSASAARRNTPSPRRPARSWCSIRSATGSDPRLQAKRSADPVDRHPPQRRRPGLAGHHRLGVGERPRGDDLAGRERGAWRGSGLSHRPGSPAPGRGFRERCSPSRPPRAGRSAGG